MLFGRLAHPITEQISHYPPCVVFVWKRPKLFENIPDSSQNLERVNHEKWTDHSAAPKLEHRACASHTSFFSSALPITSMPGMFAEWGEWMV